jgi:hypothetical protein
MIKAVIMIVNKIIAILLISSYVLVVISGKNNTKTKFEFCKILIHAKTCLETAQNEVEQWDCYGRYIFRPTTKVSNEKYMSHDCGGVGWGNSIRALYNAFGLAALLDGRLIVTYPFFDQLWNPPYGLESWDYGLAAKANHNLNYQRQRHEDHIWDYEAHGRDNHFKNWITNLKLGRDTYEGSKAIHY